MPDSHPAQTSRVGDLVVDIGRGQVTRGDVDIALPKLSFDVLVALMRAAPNLLSLDALMERVWPGLVVSPETVTQRVKILRNALGDDPRQPRYIAGVRGRGYRIVAPVEVLGASASPQFPRAASKPIDPPLQHRFPWRWEGIGAAAALLLAGVIAIAWWQHGSGARPTEIAIQGRAVIVSAAPPRSVAVLPFDNLSTRPDGNVLALGFAEQVLHELGNLSDLTVIARTSSFAFQGRNADAREIGHQLNAKFLLQGSVQSDAQRLRVTAELIDTDTDRQIWSARFDRTLTDIFAVQDEIALAVARALEVNIASGAREMLAGRGTQNLDAWLAYEQGRALLITRKLADLQGATSRFTDAARLDPSFAAAYVSQAEARLLIAFFQGSDTWFEAGPQLAPADRVDIERLLAHALELDPGNGEAYIVHAWLHEGHPLDAEADYRRGLALSPNSELGYERLARLLFFYPKSGEGYDPEKREEAFAMIDRARALNPLAPMAHLTKAQFVLFGRSNLGEARSLLLQALQTEPNSYPALTILGCVESLSGNFAAAVRYGEQAIAIEPRVFWPRPFLLHFYLDIGDVAAARQIFELIPAADTWSRIPMYLYQHDWKTAGELAYTPPATFNPVDATARFWALVQYGVVTGHLKRAKAALDQSCAARWGDDGNPVVSRTSPFQDDCVEFAALMQAAGEGDRAARLLRALLSAMDYESHDLHRGELWFGSARPEALALLGDNEAAIKALQASFAPTSINWWYSLQLDGAYDGIRNDARFAALLAQASEHAAGERSKLQQLRAQELVPRRGSD
jgi:TolB-like protein/DNA-binding winged helix-turn-helix (wHTH) protein